MSLGLDKLTDDQLFNLCKEMCNELSQRDPFIQRCSQAEIVTASEKLKIRREAISEACNTVREQYVIDLKREILADVQDAVRKGTVVLVTPQEEAQMIPEADREAREKIRATIKAAADKKLLPIYMAVKFNGRMMTVTIGSTEWAVNSTKTATEVRQIMDALIG